LQHAGFEVLLDDRDERAGVKFKDADLIGIPYRVTIGKKVAGGVVELFNRRTKQTEDVRITEVAQKLTSVQQ
jgi:prolyl-tRNA synthetase